MLFRMLQVGCFAMAVSIGSLASQTAQAQSPFAGPSCSGGYRPSLYGHQGYGQPGGFSSPGGNNVANYYGSQPSFAPPSPMGYGGYSQPSLNLNQNFYPGNNSYSPSHQYQQRPPHHPHHSNHSHSHQSDHGWHLGHYLLGI